MTASVPDKPAIRPACPLFSSGPTTKRPGWSLDALKQAALGRSHRSGEGKARLKAAIDKTRSILKIPDDYRIAIMPGSDTGALEAALWSLLGPRPVDVFAWENFGRDWVIDIVEQLAIDNIAHTADYGLLPDLSKARNDADIVFTWNGTTSGVKIPNADWINHNRKGLSICDATSALFAQELEWEKLDAITYSWQKVLGGEAAHGVLILSPRAIKRLQNHTPPWPVPKLLRLAHKQQVDQGLYEGVTINTPSFLCLEDYMDALGWVEKLGGLNAMHSRANSSLDILTKWEKHSRWIQFLCADQSLRSNTGVTFTFADPDITALPAEKQHGIVTAMMQLLETENVAYDINGYRTAPPGLRIWCGGTVEPEDVKTLTPWLDWAFHTVKHTSCLKF